MRSRWMHGGLRRGIGEVCVCVCVYVSVCCNRVVQWRFVKDMILNIVFISNKASNLPLRVKVPKYIENFNCNYIPIFIL